MIIMKFGGTSVKDSSAINNLVRIVKTKLNKNPVIVCSAISGMTDNLIRLGNKAISGNFIESEDIIESIRKKHIQIIDESFRDSNEKQNVKEKVNDYIKQLRDIIKGIHLLSELSDSSIAKILSFGEILSTTIVADILKFNGVDSQWIDAREFIKTKGNFRNAEPENELIKKKTPQYINPILDKGGVAVTQGFIGSNSSGVTTVFSRGGSDFSASLIGIAMDAEEIEIWTDTDGILTGDPKIISNPLSVREISFEEASELALSGAKVLHPLTIIPVIEKNIPVRILNSHNPEFTGTLISRNKCINQPPVKSVTSKQNITVLNVYTREMLFDYGFLKRVFEVFDKYRTSVDLMTSSKGKVSITIDDNTHINDIIEELSLFSEVKVEMDKSIVCVVGSNLKNTKGIEAQILNALKGFNITMISQGASEINFSFVIERKKLDSVIQTLHKRFFED